MEKVPPNMLVGGLVDFVFAGEEIKNGIDKKILDELTAKAKENPRLRCNDIVPGGVVLNIEKGQWHSLKCLESGTVLFEAKDGGIGRWKRMRSLIPKHLKAHTDSTDDTDLFFEHGLHGLTRI